jgi:flagellar FliJ protein
MKRFHFPLRPVAVVRAHRELRAREALALALRDLAGAEGRLTACRARSGDLESLIAAGRGQKLLAAAAVAGQQAYLEARAAEGEAEKQVAAARVELLRRRAVGVEANRELKVIRRLEDLAREAHRADSLRSAQNEIDEIAGYRAFRNRPTL